RHCVRAGAAEEGIPHRRDDVKLRERGIERRQKANRRQGEQRPAFTPGRGIVAPAGRDISDIWAMLRCRWRDCCALHGGLASASEDERPGERGPSEGGEGARDDAFVLGGPRLVAVVNRAT